MSASFTPDYFDRKDISWTVGDAALISVDGEDKSAGVQAKKDAKWIRDLIAADQGRHVNTPYEIQTASGSRTTKVTVIGDDMLGNRQTASCRVQVDFRTVDESKICVEGIRLIPKTLQYEIKRTRTGAGYRPVEAWTGTGAKKLAAVGISGAGVNQKVTYQASDDSLVCIIGWNRDGRVKKRDRRQNMEYICGITFAPFAARGRFATDETKKEPCPDAGENGSEFCNLCAEWSAANSAVGRNLLYGICDNVRRCLQHVQRETGCGEWRSGPGEENFIPVSRHWHIGTMRYMQNRQNRWLRPGTADGSMLETNRILAKISLQSV